MLLLQLLQRENLSHYGITERPVYFEYDAPLSFNLTNLAVMLTLSVLYCTEIVLLKKIFLTQLKINSKK